MAVAPRIPVPPIPVMPPEGIAPVTDPASTGTAPDASPTTMVLQYLKSRGFTPSSENVRRALEANQRDPGVIPGLRSDRGATDAEDQAAMRAAGKGAGGGASGPSNLVQEEGTWDTRGRPQGATPPMDRRDNTSAAPSTNTSSSTPPPDADYSGPGWGTAAAGSGLALANAILNRQPSAQFVGNAQPPSGKVTDVDLPPNAALPSPSPMSLALDKAVTPQLAAPAPQIAGPPPVAEAPVAAPASTIVPPVTPESNAPLPFSSTSPRRPPTPQAPMPTVVVRPPGAARLNPAILGEAANIARRVRP